ncbi:MAG: metallophosphoesterase [Candidatus Kapabacteria bacterium]|nr:metallophosphoesterase [Candidatus Kapabacteria bacterium]
MDSHQLLKFVITSSVILFLIDVYCLLSWQRFVKNMRWNKWVSRVPWIISITLLFLSPYVSFQRSNTARLDDWLYALFIVTILWYIPKLPIAIFLVCKDIVYALYLGIRKLVKKKTQPEPETTNESRRKIIQSTAWSIATVPFFVIGRGMTNVDNIEVFYHDLELPKLTSAFDGIKIIQISDIHAGSFRDYRPFQEARRIIETHKPDLLLITGDFVNFQSNELAIIRPELEKLKADLGVWASLGNHDHYTSKSDHDRIKSIVTNSGIKLLVNENHQFTIDNEVLQLIGTDNTGLGQNFADLPTALIGTIPDYPTILMAHDPTFWDKEIRGKTQIDLMLSGHTHGGQFAMDFFGKQVSPAQFVYKQWAGLYSDAHQHLYVNRGLGTVGIPVRVGIPPEITVITLRKQKTLLG